MQNRGEVDSILQIIDLIIHNSKQSRVLKCYECVTSYQ